MILKKVSFQILLNFLQPSFQVTLLRRRVPCFLLHSHVISQTLNQLSERRRDEDTGPERRSRESVSILSAEPQCHGDYCMRDWEAAFPQLYHSWLLSFLTNTQKCQKIKYPTYSFQSDNIKSYFSRSFKTLSWNWFLAQPILDSILCIILWTV